MMNYRNGAVALFCVFVVSGCASVAPNYQPDFELVNKLKDIDAPSMKTGEFTEADASVNRVTIRGMAMESPVAKSYAAYLKTALKEELKQASLYDESSEIVISGELLSNAVNALGINIGTANLSARFIVTNSGEERYNKIHSISHEWESSFMGAVAATRTQTNYPIAVQKLLNAFLLDKAFVAALKK